MKHKVKLMAVSSMSLVYAQMEALCDERCGTATHRRRRRTKHWLPRGSGVYMGVNA